MLTGYRNTHSWPIAYRVKQLEKALKTKPKGANNPDSRAAFLLRYYWENIVKPTFLPIDHPPSGDDVLLSAILQARLPFSVEANEAMGKFMGERILGQFSWEPLPLLQLLQALQAYDIFLSQTRDCNLVAAALLIKKGVKEEGIPRYLELENFRELVTQRKGIVLSLLPHYSLARALNVIVTTQGGRGAIKDLSAIVGFNMRGGLDLAYFIEQRTVLSVPKNTWHYWMGR